MKRKLIEVTSGAALPGTHTSSVVERTRYEGRCEVDASDADRIAGRLRKVIDGVVWHIVPAPGAESAPIVFEISVENSYGFSEAVAGFVGENIRALGINGSDFEDVEW